MPLNSLNSTFLISPFYRWGERERVSNLAKVTQLGCMLARMKEDSNPVTVMVVFNLFCAYQVSGPC